jgi:hypothetical protein
MSDGIHVTSRLEEFDANARLQDLPYQGGLYTVSRAGVHKQKS